MSAKRSSKGFIVAGIGLICVVVGIGMVVSSFLRFASELAPNNSPFGHLSTTIGNKTISTKTGITLQGNEEGNITIYPDRPPTPLFAQFIFGGLLAAGGGFLIKLGLGIAVVENADSIADWTRNVFSKREASGTSYETRQSARLTCPECGTVVSDTSNFCSECGRKLKEENS